MAAEPCPKAVRPRADDQIKVGLQAVPVIVSGDQLPCIRVQPQHRVRPVALHREGSRDELLLLIEGEPVVLWGSCDARVVSVRG